VSRRDEYTVKVGEAISVLH